MSCRPVLVAIILVSGACSAPRPAPVLPLALTSERRLLELCIADLSVQVPAHGAVPKELAGNGGLLVHHSFRPRMSQLGLELSERLIGPRPAIDEAATALAAPDRIGGSVYELCPQWVVGRIGRIVVVDVDELGQTLDHPRTIYPKMTCWLQLTRPAYSAGGSIALVYAEIGPPGFDLGFAVVLLKRGKRGWRVVDRALAWTA